MSDTLLRAIARDAGIQICAASTTELVERAHEIHNPRRWLPQPSDER